MSLLPDKPAHQSMTVWGNVVKAIGLVIGAIGLAMTGEQGWHSVADVVTSQTVIGAFTVAIGAIIASIGQRRKV